ncbi:MAG: sulfite exporter TauE/SafE family protein [Rhodospirillaceae bacterium]
MDFLPFEPTTWNIVLVVIAFTAAGLSKGVLGIGIPLISVPLLTGIMHPALTISVLAIPILSSNVWQALEGGRSSVVAKRFWNILVALVIGAGLGAQFLTSADPLTAQMVIGVIVILFSLTQFKTLTIPDPGLKEKWLSPVIGFIAGVIGGIATFFGPVLIPYLISLRLSKDMFVSTIAVLYLMGTLPLFALLAWKGVLGQKELILSAIGTVFVMGGVVVGRKLRNVISQEVFRRGLLILLVIMAFNMIRRAVM